MKRARCRERDVPANRCCNGTTRIVIASNPDPGAGGRWAAGYVAARKDLDNDHAAAAARARRAMIGHGVGIDCVVRCRRLCAKKAPSHENARRSTKMPDVARKCQT